ncbi:hypothetical protein GOODEAATRI_033174 [Goodea atripinnis]|uniref:Secreted protein n=1 Tax=Goodea atripinnis TaxID=208336 RepID=A0ABV0NRT4_9TELE
MALLQLLRALLQHFQSRLLFFWTPVVFVPRPKTTAQQSLLRPGWQYKPAGDQKDQAEMIALWEYLRRAVEKSSSQEGRGAAIAILGLEAGDSSTWHRHVTSHAREHGSTPLFNSTPAIPLTIRLLATRK